MHIRPLTLIALALAATAFTSCQKPVAKSEAPLLESTPAPALAVTSAPEADPVIEAAPRPEPAAIKDQPSTTNSPAAAPELAPAGVFYLVEEARIETDSGVTGLPPGTGVKLLHDDLYQTPAGEAHLASAQVTNDLTVARAALTAERARQGAAQARIASEGTAASARARAEAMATPTPYEATQRTGSAADPNPLNRATDPINTTHSSTKDKVYQGVGGEYWKDIYGKRHYFK